MLNAYYMWEIFWCDVILYMQCAPIKDNFSILVENGLQEIGQLFEWFSLE